MSLAYTVSEITSFLANYVKENLVTHNKLQKIRTLRRAKIRHFEVNLALFEAEEVRNSSNYAPYGRNCTKISKIKRFLKKNRGGQFPV